MDRMLLRDDQWGRIKALLPENQATAVMPPRSNRKIARQYDKVLYRERNLAERVFQKLKHYRRIATCYERLAIICHAMLHLVATLIWHPPQPNRSPSTAILRLLITCAKP